MLEVSWFNIRIQLYLAKATLCEKQGKWKFYLQK